MADALPPFSLTSVCPKCGMVGGGPDRTVAFGSRSIPVPPPDPFPVEYHPTARDTGRFACPLELFHEHLCRVCPRCGFRWAEACPSPHLAAAPAAVPTPSQLPFQTSEIPCPKCSVRFRLFERTCRWSAAGAREGFARLPECLVLTCPICGFVQLMATADAVPPNEAAQ